jgi:hypothetical protein
MALLIKFDARMTFSNLQSQIELFSSLPAKLTEEGRQQALDVFYQFKAALNAGQIRAASRCSGGQWEVQPWVKRGI